MGAVALLAVGVVALLALGRMFCWVGKIRRTNCCGIKGRMRIPAITESPNTGDLEEKDVCAETIGGCCCGDGEDEPLCEGCGLSCVEAATTALTPFLLFKATFVFCAFATAVGCGLPAALGCEAPASRGFGLRAKAGCVCADVGEGDLLGGSCLFGVAGIAGCEAEFATTTGEAMRGVGGASG